MSAAIRFSWPIASTTAVCLGQTGTAAFVINGTLHDTARTSTGVFMAKFPGLQRTVSLTSAGNISAVDFTIVGTNLRGVAVTETRAGPNANTVETTAEYHSVTSVTPSANVGTATSLGTGTTGSTNWIVHNTFAQNFQIAGQFDVTATLNYTVNYTDDDVQTNTSPVSTVWGAGVSGATTDQVASILFPIRASRVVINSSDATGALTASFVQTGI